MINEKLLKLFRIIQTCSRSTFYHPDKTLQIQAQTSTRSRSSNIESSLTEDERYRRKSKSTPLQGTTKATLWIESRKTSPRKGSRQSPGSAPGTPPLGAGSGRGTPLRLAVLRKAQSAQKYKITKIEEPLKIGEFYSIFMNISNR